MCCGSLRERNVLLEECEGLPSDELPVTEMSVVPLAFDGDGKWVSADTFRTADGSWLSEIEDVLQEQRGRNLGDRAVLELELGVRPCLSQTTGGDRGADQTNG